MACMILSSNTQIVLGYQRILWYPLLYKLLSWDSFENAVPIQLLPQQSHKVAGAG